MRTEEQAILVGTNTALNDNPSLNVRSWFGENPVRVVLDRSLKIPRDYNLLDGSIKTIILTEQSFENSNNLSFEEIDFSKKCSRTNL